jgi:hypothetical protein
LQDNRQADLLHDRPRWRVSGSFYDGAGARRLSFAPRRCPWASTWRWLPWSKAVDHVDDAAEQVKRHRQLGHLEDGICFVVVAMSELEAML